MPRLNLTICAVILASTLPARALVTQEAAIPNAQLFGIRFTADHAEYYARADLVRGISLQQYFTAAFVVTELVVEVEGAQSQLRIYHALPADVPALVEEAARTAGSASSRRAMPSVPQAALPAEAARQRLGAMIADALEESTGDYVFKEYPVTTHARTIEYRIGRQEELLALFRALREAWTGLPVDPTQSEGTDEAGAEAEGAASGNEEEASEGRLPLGGTLFIVEP